MQHRFAVLHALQEEKINPAEAKRLLKVDDKTLNQLMTLWSPYLPKISPLFDQLLKETNTKREQTAIKRRIAKEIPVTMRQVNRLISRAEITVPPPISSKMRRFKRETAQNRRKEREKHAIDLISGSNSAVEAAEAAGISERHIYRLANKLCDMAGVRFRDLGPASPDQRLKVTVLLEDMLGHNVK